MPAGTAASMSNSAATAVVDVVGRQAQHYAPGDENAGHTS